MSLTKFNRGFPLFDSLFPYFTDATDRLIDDDFFMNKNWIPAMNVKDLKDEFEIEVSAPGFKKDEFEVSITDNILTISAEAKAENEEKKDTYTRKEFSTKSFKRMVTVPNNIDLSKKIKANYEHGILIIHLEKMALLKSDDHKKVIEIN